MEVARSSNESVQMATGKGWDEWFAILHAMGASDLPHKEIAASLVRDHGVPGWWAQSITVAFERAIGRREVGQSCGGDFSASASRTLAGSLDDAVGTWRRLVANRRDFNGVPIESDPRVSHTEKWRYWRADLADGSKIRVGIGERPGGRAGLGLSHEKLGDRQAAERWKKYWRNILKELG